MRAAFAAFTADDACIRYRRKAAGELAKHEQVQRIEQLAARRAEQTNEVASQARIVGAFGADSEVGEAVSAALQEVQQEQARTLAELRYVREEYDRAKWKGRWDPPGSGSGK